MASFSEVSHTPTAILDEAEFSQNSNEGPFLPLPTQQDLLEHGAAYFGTISRARINSSLDKAPQELTDPQYLNTLFAVGSEFGFHADFGSLLAALPAESIIALPNESVQKLLSVLEKYPDQLTDFIGQLLVKIGINNDQNAAGRLTALRSIGILSRLQTILDEWKTAEPQKYNFSKQALDEMAQELSIKPFKGLWFN